MATPTLGRLQRVPLHKAQGRQEPGCTCWLAEAAEIALLDDMARLFRVRVQAL